MEILVNGKPHQAATGLTVAALLSELGIAPKLVAVERNLDIIAKGAFDSTELVAGDKVEIIQFVGGGI